MNSASSIQFVIPVLNEESTIGKTISSIEQYTPDDIEYSIVVVDNGSTDRTKEIVKSTVAQLLEAPGESIAALRNIGVEHSDYDILVFLDADILLTKKWKDSIKDAINLLKQDPMTVTGSRVNPEDNVRWLNRFWFEPMTRYKAPYINSGHLITSRLLFKNINGFDSGKRTAEDYDFCMRAKAAGASLIDNRDLKVLHLGYPRDIKGFVMREKWHGKQDYESLKSIMDSKIAWLGIINIFVFFIAIIVAIFFTNVYWLLIYPILIYGLAILLSVIKFGYSSVWFLMNNALAFVFYITGRSISFLSIVLGM